MKELFKKSFELYRKKNRLRRIDKECDKYNKLKIKLNQQQYVVNFLVEKYNELYGVNLRNNK